MKQWIVIAFVVNYATTNYMMEKSPILKDYNELFLKACAKSNPKTLQKLLDKGADIQTTNYNLENCLHIVKKTETAEVLLKNIKDNQENPNLLHNLLEQKNKQSKTPLAMATAHLNEDIVSFLLKLGANPNCVDNTDETPFHHLARIKNVPEPEDDFGDTLVEGINTGLKDNISHYLHRAHANVNAKNILGQTPCHLIVSQPVWDSELLITYLNIGANLAITNAEQQSVLSLMCENGTAAKIASIMGSAQLPLDICRDPELISLRLPILNEYAKQILSEKVIDYYIKKKKSNQNDVSKDFVFEQKCAQILLKFASDKAFNSKSHAISIAVLSDKIHITRYRQLEKILRKLTTSKKHNPNITGLIMNAIDYQCDAQPIEWVKMISSIPESENKYVAYLLELITRTITPEFYAKRAGFAKEYKLRKKNLSSTKPNNN